MELLSTKHSHQGSQSLLFSKRKAGKGGEVLEVVSYWDRTLLDVDLISHAAGGKNLGSVITLHDSGCTVQLQAGMTARLKKSDKSIVEARDEVVHVGKDEIMHITQGNLDFVLSFVHIPPFILPRMRGRDALYTAILLLSSLLYLGTASWIYLTQATSVEKVQESPWTIVNMPRLPEKPQVAPRPVPPPQMKADKTTKKQAEPKPILQTRPLAAAQSPASDSSKAPNKPAASDSSKAPNKPAASAGAGGSKGETQASSSQPDFSRLRAGSQILNRTGPGAASIGFRDPAAGSPGSKGPDAGALQTSGLDPGKGLALTGTGAAVDTFQKGAGTSGLSTENGFEGEKAGRSRAAVSMEGGGDPVSGGGLSAEEVQKVIRIHLNGIRHCYEQLLQRSPSASGKITVQFVIGSSGRVENVQTAQDTIGDAGMSGCVSAKIARWTFPMPRGGQPVHVNYPFVFNPR